MLEVKTLAPAGDPKLVNMSSLSDYTPGLGHISIDLSRVCTDLTRFLLTMQKESVSRFSIAISLLQKPQKMMLGSTVMEVAFITDADRTILELVRFVKKVEDRPEYDAEW